MISEIYSASDYCGGGSGAGRGAGRANFLSSMGTLNFAFSIFTINRELGRAIVS